MPCVDELQSSIPSISETATNTMLKNFAFVSLLITSSSWVFGAEIITQEQSIDFGELAANFSVNSSLQVDPAGGFMTSGPMYVISPPQPARIRLSGYPANQALSITISNFFLVPTGGDRFLVKDFALNTTTTDNNGDALILIGATLYADAGNTYLDTAYSGNMIVDISYP